MAVANNQHPRSLRRRLAIQIGTMVIGLLLISVAAVVGIEGLHHDFGDALRGYQQLRAVYEIGLNVTTARSLLQDDSPDLPAARAAMQAAILKLQTSPEVDGAALQADLQRALATMSPAPLEQATAQLAALSAGIRTSLVARQQAADQKRRITLISVIILCGLIVAGGIAVGVQQYRSVIRPLRKLSLGVRAVAGGEFNRPVEAAGDLEFSLLARDFNRMANELENLYQNLEQQVQLKSKELVRSERLASVGYLAAGVAHEINNPLGIITGYGERALMQLQRDSDPQTLERARKAIAVICEEAFRCKQITDRLLSLARPGNEDRTAVSLPTVTEEVISIVGSLPEHRDRKITLETGPRDELFVHARDGEMKQIIFNLVINALEAVDPGAGQATLNITRDRDEVELIISDNGRGMDAQTLDRVFEPFFTSKRGGRHGTGLGLSITYAIIADHGGTIRAESDGIGSGSRFIVRLPAERKGAEHARR